MRLLYSYSSCLNNSPILLMEYSHTGILGYILITDGARGILAAIIYEEQLKVLISLCQYAIDTAA